MTAGPGREVAALYETLARFQWWRRRWSRAAPGEGLELRKRLAAPVGAIGPPDGAAGLDRWLQARLGSRPSTRVLDLGCGFGVSLLRWLEAGASTGVGVTASTFQRERANAEAARRQLSGRCQFVRQDYAVRVPGSFDVVLAIEALGHAHDLDAVLRTAHEALVPGGVFLWLEDALQHDASGDTDDPDVEELAARWASPRLRAATSMRQALGRAGLHLLHETDLTAQVPVAPMLATMAKTRRMRCCRALLPMPPTRRLLDAFLGGLALERLYSRGLACYRVWMSERAHEVV